MRPDDTTPKPASAAGAVGAARWSGLPSDALGNVLLALHPDDRPVASLVCKSWLRSHDELVTVLADPQPLEVRPLTSRTQYPRIGTVSGC